MTFLSNVFNFRYFVRHLQAKNAISAESLPLYFDTWLQKGSELCIFTAPQLKKFSEKHLESGGWYLDCSRNYTPPSELADRAKLEGGHAPLEDKDEGGHEEEVTEPPKLKKKRLTKAEKEKLENEKAEKELKEKLEKEKAEKELKEKLEKEKAEKEKAEREAEAAKEPGGQEEVSRQEPAREVLEEADDDSAPPFEQAQGDCVTPQAPDSSISNAYHATAKRLRKKKRDQFPSASSSIIDQHSMQVYVECTSLSELLKAAEVTSCTDPRWLRLHATIAKVFLFSSYLELDGNGCSPRNDQLSHF